MKAITIILFVTLSISSQAQRIIITPNNSGEITLTLTKKETVKDGFKMLAMLIPSDMKWYDRYVVKDSITYYQPGIRFSKKIYKVVDRNLIRVRL